MEALKRNKGRSEKGKLVEIKALQKLTLVDYPGKVACTLFTFGCNFRCPFCFNASLVFKDDTPTIQEGEIMGFLKERKDWFDGVCVTGGEPTLNEDLPKFVGKIKKMGFEVKLDTNGTNPKMLGQLIEDGSIDYVALDLKGPFEKYEKIVKVKVKVGDIRKSLKLMIDSNVDHEIRTTIVPRLHSKRDIVNVARRIRGASKYFLQQFRPINTLDPKFMHIEPPTQEELFDMREACEEYVPTYVRA